MIKKLIIPLAVLCYTGLQGKAVRAAEPFVPGKVIGRVSCKADPAQSYALYIPVRGNKEPLPVIYFFDAHGAGALPLNKYKALADVYGFILIGSNNSKNGNDWSTTETIWDRLFDDTRKRLAINENRIYTGGFSGGAKVAGYVAINHPVVKGVIANGAGLPDGVSAGDFRFSFTAITGEGDMNMTELVAITGDLDKTRTRHRLLFFDGIHEWAPEATMRTAFAGLELDAMQGGLITKDARAINGYTGRSKGRLEDDIRKGELIRAHRECEVSVSYLSGVTGEADWFRQRLVALDRDQEYQKQLQVQQRLLVTEQNTKAAYMQQFEHGDIAYWTGVIDDLRTKAATAGDGRTRTAASAMYQRLLAYLSLAFYSISNQLINGNRNDAAQHFVQLYKMADPANSEAWIFSAILHARGGDDHAAADDLLKAAANGFNDKGRLRQQPEFRRIDLARIEAAMH